MAVGRTETVNFDSRSLYRQGIVMVEETDRTKNTVGIGLAIGVALGLILGTLIDQLGLGIAIGAALGLVFGSAAEMSGKDTVPKA